MKSIQFLKKNAMAIVAAVAILGFSSFKLAENKLDEITFQYQPPSGSNPFDQAKVQDQSNWTPALASCSTEEDQEVACSITVPLANTMNGGTQIDPSKVTIHTSLSPAGANNYLVTPNPSSAYTNEVNRPLP
jgi:hypothetical protein